MTKNVLLVLEKPWDTPEDDMRRASVLPFLEGLARKLDFDVYYSTFYNASSFKLALENDLIHTQQPRQIIYIGMHGHYKKTERKEAVKMMNTVVNCGDKVEGIILGSCFFGADENILKSALEKKVEAGTYGANWIFGYQHAMDWISSTLIDLAVLESVMSSDRLKKEDTVLEAFANSLNFFNMRHLIGQSKSGHKKGEKHNDKKLKESMRLFFRGQGGTTPKDLTEDLIAQISI